MNKKTEEFLKKIQQLKTDNPFDLSSLEDLSIAIMNLISIEEHLFFTWNKTQDDQYLTFLNEIRIKRIELLKNLIKDYQGEVWCISKHLLASSMRIMEVGTKYLKEEKKDEAKKFFKDSYEIFNLFLTLILENHQNYKKNNIVIEKNHKISTKEKGILAKLGEFIKLSVDCCKE